MVADSALYSRKNLEMLQNISWISRVPLSLKSAENLVKQIPEESLVESGIKGYTKAETTSNYGGIAQRWLVVCSQSRREADLLQLEKKNVNVLIFIGLYLGATRNTFSTISNNRRVGTPHAS